MVDMKGMRGPQNERKKKEPREKSLKMPRMFTGETRAEDVRVWVGSLRLAIITIAPKSIPGSHEHTKFRKPSNFVLFFFVSSLAQPLLSLVLPPMISQHAVTLVDSVLFL